MMQSNQVIARDLRVAVITKNNKKGCFKIPINDFYKDSILQGKILHQVGLIPIDNKIIENSRLLAIRYQDKTKKEIKVYKSLGWIDESFYITPSIYIHNGKKYQDKAHQIELDNPGKAANLDLKHLDDSELKSVSAHMVSDLLKIQEPEVMYPLLGACYAAPLITPLELQHKPVIWLHGPSGTGKTTIARLVQNFYGDFTDPSSITSWDSTPNEIERQGHYFKDAVYMVDDFKKATLGNGIKNAHRVMQNYADFTGRSRMNTSNHFYIKGLLLVTGEDLPEEREALRARCLVLPIEKGHEDFLYHLESCNQQKDKYPGIMADYIALLQKQDMDGTKKQHEELKSLYREKIDGRPNADRIAENYALEHLGFRGFLSHMFGLGAISEETLEGMDSEMEEILLSRIEAEAEEIEGTNSTSRFPEIINEIIGSGNAHIRGLGAEQGSCIGVLNNNEVLFYPSQTYNVLDRYLKSCGKSGCELGQRSYAAALVENGFLKTGTKGHHTQQRRLEGKRVRVWVIDAVKLERE